MEFFDTHAHYDDEKFDEDREEVINKIYNDDITKFVSAGYNLESSKKALELARKYNFIYTTCGISPNDVKTNISDMDCEISKIRDLISNNIGSKKIVGVGEIGLDYYWNKENKEIQEMAFIKQIEIANEYNLPIIIHTRDAISDTLNIIKNKKRAQSGGIIHCCPLNRELVKEVLNLGFYISFSGTITFKNSKNADEIINLVPMDRILIETDSPYLAPEPKRGTRNDSRNVKFIAEKIASSRNMKIEDVSRKTYDNAMKVFKITK